MTICPPSGLVAPEGTYKLTSSYSLPFAPTSLTSLGSTTMPTTYGAISTNNSTTPSGTFPNTQSTSGTTLNAGNNGGQRTNNGAKEKNLDSGETNESVSSIQGRVTSSEQSEPATALRYISLQAPSAWAGIPIPPSSRISIASVRHLQSSVLNGSSPSGSQLGTANQKREKAPSMTSEFAQGVDKNKKAENILESASFPSAGMSASLSELTARETAPPPLNPVLESVLAAQGVDGAASHVTGGQGGMPGMAALQLLSHIGGQEQTRNTTSTLLTSNATGPTSTTGKLRPKNNIKQTSSSFVQRLQSHNELSKILGPRNDGMAIDRHVFVSRGRMFFWLGETASGWIRDPLARLNFSSPIMSHDINQWTRSPSRLDVIIGFSSSDILWLEAVSMRYSRINKGGCINDAPITSVRWLPGSESLFFASHNDGTCTIFDVAREDSSSGSWVPSNSIRKSKASESTTLEGDKELLAEKQDTWINDSKAVRTWNPKDCILVTKPSSGENVDSSKKVWTKMNPVAHWRVTRNSSITDMAFSPDHTKLAFVSTDGHLRIINLLTELLEGTFESYYGALNCVVWSPDAKFLLTAGCDDLISIWTSSGHLLSRCRGHSSFVTGVSFDPWRWRVEDRTYRFVSVGEDGRVFLWDFSAAALQRPRPHGQYQRRTSSGPGPHASTASLLRGGYNRHASLDHISPNGVPGRAVYQSAPSRRQVAELQPVASYQIEPLLSDSSAPTSSLIPLVPNSSSTEAKESSSSEGAEVGASVTNAIVASGTTLSHASSTNNPNHSTQLPTSSAGATVGTNAASSSFPHSSEPGGSNDLLVAVRCRPDGILLVHKSGTLRFLHRPEPPNATVHHYPEARSQWSNVTEDRSAVVSQS